MLQLPFHEPLSIRGLGEQGLEALLGLFYPEVCQVCTRQSARPADGYVCVHCWHQIRFIVPPFCERCGLPFEGEIHYRFECPNCRGSRLYFDSARAAVHATGVALEVMHRFKYQNARWFEPFLADLLHRALTQSARLTNWERIIPVPLHPVKRRERGFNQAEALARRLAQQTGLPVQTNAVVRPVATPSQTRLSRQDRTANMKDAFQVRSDCDLRGTRALLIDDVFTTGATTNACARALKKAGADRVDVWTVARGI